MCAAVNSNAPGGCTSFGAIRLLSDLFSTNRQKTLGTKYAHIVTGVECHTTSKTNTTTHKKKAAKHASCLDHARHWYVSPLKGLLCISLPPLHDTNTTKKYGNKNPFGIVQVRHGYVPPLKGLHLMARPPPHKKQQQQVKQQKHLLPCPSPPWLRTASEMAPSNFAPTAPQ